MPATMVGTATIATHPPSFFITSFCAARAGGLWGLCHEDAQASCCTRDEGGPFAVALEGETANSQKLLQPKAVVVTVLVKRRHIDDVM
jgi:hypothetical protein